MRYWHSPACRSNLMGGTVRALLEPGGKTYFKAAGGDTKVVLITSEDSTHGPVPSAVQHLGKTIHRWSRLDKNGQSGKCQTSDNRMFTVLHLPQIISGLRCQEYACRADTR